MFASSSSITQLTLIWVSTKVKRPSFGFCEVFHVQIALYPLMKQRLQKLSSTPLTSIVFSEDDYSCTPLHVAAAYNNSAIVEILASNGGDLESTTFYMLQTSLHYAARYDSPSSVKKLVEMGAEIEARYNLLMNV
eukprot:sb/3474751/